MNRRSRRKIRKALALVADDNLDWKTSQALSYLRRRIIRQRIRFEKAGDTEAALLFFDAECEIDNRRYESPLSQALNDKLARGEELQ